MAMIKTIWKNSLLYTYNFKVETRFLTYLCTWKSEDSPRIVTCNLDYDKR